MIQLTPFQYRLVQALEKNYYRKLSDGKKVSINDCDALAIDLGLDLSQREDVKKLCNSLYGKGEAIDSNNYSVKSTPEDLWRDLAKGLNKYNNISWKEDTTKIPNTSIKTKRIKRTGDILTCRDGLEEMVQASSLLKIIESNSRVIDDNDDSAWEILDKYKELARKLEWPLDYSYCQSYYADIFNGQQCKHNIDRRTPVFFYRFINPSSFIVSGNGVSYYDDKILHYIPWSNLKKVEFNHLFRNFKFLSTIDSESFDISAYDLLKFNLDKAGFATLITAFIEDWKHYVTPVIEERKKIADELINNLGIPINVHAFVEDKYATNTALDILNKYNELKESLDVLENGSADYNMLKKQLSDFRLNAFSKISIRCESEKVLYFYKPYEDNRILAEVNGSPDILRQEYGPFLNDYYRISCLNEDFKRDIESGIQFVGQNIDTLCRYKKELDENAASDVQARTKELIKVANKYTSVAKCVNSHCEIINSDLLYARLRAYHNIFLGVELANFIGSKGGKKLAVVEDIIKTANDTSFTSLNVNINDLKFDTLSAINSSLDTVTKALNEISASNGASSARTIGNGLFKIASGLLASYTQMLEENIEVQEKAISMIESSSDCIVNCGAHALRSIEIVGAIEKADEGFWAIYEPLRDKVFKSPFNYEPNAEECYTFLNAICAYHKISQSQL